MVPNGSDGAVGEHRRHGDAGQVFGACAFGLARRMQRIGEQRQHVDGQRRRRRPSTSSGRRRSGRRRAPGPSVSERASATASTMPA